MAQTIIGTSITVDGEILGDEPLLVRGTVKGRIHLTAAVQVDTSGVVEAEVRTSEAHVAGQVTGNVTATERVEIQPGGRLTGNIRAPRILIADGALFKGTIDMDV
ncbi:MAG: hypothetical protein AMXMBFR64_18790 [Myxococcales bacterium]